MALRSLNDLVQKSAGLDEDEKLTFTANLAWILIMQRDPVKAAEAYQLNHDHLADFHRAWGENSAKYFQVVDTLGSAARMLRRLDEAADWHRQAFEGRERLLGKDHPDTTISLSNRGLDLLDSGKLAEAEALFRELAARTRVAREGDLRLHVTSLFNLGLALRGPDNLSKARWTG
jgi:tetratricopeptide (TPR) repeat protein